ncbi:MAG: fatty acid desaturase [Planctomycetaceae bacterium]|nr:fatty acid desaturase [Planctomycetaceae bacterium]
MSATIPTLAVPKEVLTPAEVRRQQAVADNEALISAFHKDQLSWKNVDWTVTLFLIGVHVACIAAPFFFSWQGLAVAVLFHWATCSLGICLGYHRYLAHKSMKLRSPAEFFVMLCGVLSGEGTPLTWAATHRLHHQKSDHVGDPHSPLDGPWWSHFLWLFPKRPTTTSQILYRRYVPELVDRPMMQFFEKTFVYWLWAAGLTLLGAGWLAGGWQLGVSMLVWGMGVRMTFAYHSTWLINSATHLWGYRNYDTRDHSRNLWWVAILAYGEGWHNNHHAHPALAPAGHRWWEVDITWWSIKALRLVGQAYDVKDKLPKGRAANDQDVDELETAPLQLKESAA